MGRVSSGDQKIKDTQKQNGAPSAPSSGAKKQRRNRDNGRIAKRPRANEEDDVDEEYIDSVLDSDVIGEFKCSKCPNVYATKGLLSQHVKVHSDSRLFCDICFKSFSTPPNLKDHIVSFHTEDGKLNYAKKLERKRILSKGRREKPRPYLEAQKAKRALAKISKKIAVHTALNENDIKCDKCPARFSSTDELDVHFFKHHPTSVKKPKQLVCSFAKCLVTFKTTEELDAHLKTHRKCLICGNMFKSAKLVKKHWMRHHNDKNGQGKVDLRKICDIVDSDDDDYNNHNISKSKRTLPLRSTRSRGRPPKSKSQQELTTIKKESPATTVKLSKSSPELESKSTSTSTSTVVVKKEDYSSSSLSSSSTEQFQPIVFEKIKVEATEKDLNNSESYDSTTCTEVKAREVKVETA